MKSRTFQSDDYFSNFLRNSGGSILCTTYSANQLIAVSATPSGKIRVATRSFDRAMGFALQGNKMAVATRNEVIELRNDPRLAGLVPGADGADACFLPRAVFFTGEADLHDLHFGSDGLYAVNTEFSCIAKIDAEYSWTPVWHPPFLSGSQPGDICHLNGLAMKDGQPQWATALAPTQLPGAWRETLDRSGVLMDIPSNSILLSDLPMPHSPRWTGTELYFLLSASGKLVRYEADPKHLTEISSTGRFLRGLAVIGDHAIAGTSRILPKSKILNQLPIAAASRQAGLLLIHLPSGEVRGEMKFPASIEEIFDIQFLHGVDKPFFLNTRLPTHQRAISTPDRSFWQQS